MPPDQDSPQSVPTAPPKQKAENNRNLPVQGNMVNKPDALAFVVSRNFFYRDGYRTLQKMVLILGLGNIALIALVAGLVVFNKPIERYFATTQEGQIIQLVPLNQPLANDAQVVSWASAAVTEVMTFGFHDYRTRLQTASRHFTNEGWNSFVKALGDARVVEAVQTRQQVVTAAPQAAAVVVRQGLENNVYTWYLEMPFLVTFQSGSRTDSQRYFLQIKVVRVSTLENPTGLGIDQWIARSGGG